MKLIKSIIASGFILGLAAPSVYAASSQQEKLEKELAQVTQQTVALQKQVKQLQTEIAQMRHGKTQTAAAASGHRVKSGKRTHLTYAHEDEAFKQGEHGATAGRKDQYSIGSYVTTSPFIGLRSAYNASDLLVTLPTMNEDLRLLEQRAALEKRLPESELLYLRRPLLELSGKIESQLVWQDPFDGKNRSDVDLSAAEFDVLAEASKYVMGFMSLTYDDSPLDPVLAGNGNREGNSRIFLNRGFLTIGNLNSSPVYFTIGQVYVPFGSYGSYLVSSPLTQVLGRVRTRAVELGFAKDGVYGSAYAFDGNVKSRDRNIDDFGFNLGYKTSRDKLKFDAGLGYVNDLAESQGMQDTGKGRGSFEGFGATAETENLNRRVGGGDLHARLGYGNADFMAEYITAMRHYSPMDLTFDGQGAKPRALHTEAAYNFHLFGKPSSAAVAYDESWQSLAIGLPKNSYRAVFNISIWKNTIESLEYRYDVNYAGTDSAGGRCPGGFCAENAGGSRQNTILAQIGVYF